MDHSTVFTKTAKGLMEATGKTSVLSRDLRSILKEIDGRATVGEVQDKLGKVPEAKLQEALKTLAGSDFIREFTPAARTTAPPPSPATGGLELDFTGLIPTRQPPAGKAEAAAKQQARATAAAAEAAARAKAEAEARAKAAVAEAAARARAEAAATAAARARAEAEARAKAAAAEAAARARTEAEAREAARARAEADARAKRDAEERARREAEERSRVEAEVKARLEEERKAREEAERKAKEQAERERKEAEEKARHEADELRAKLDEERRAREEAERKAKEQAERARKEAEEKARREADELRAKLDEERRAREEAERKAKEQVERARREAEEKARREADELRAKLDEERRAREEAERKVKEQAERARKEAEEKARREADELRAKLDDEHKAKEDAERKAKEEADRLARDAVETARAEAKVKARQDAEDQARRDAEDQARREAAERAQRDAEEKARKAAADNARREAEERDRREAEERARKEADEKREAEEQVRQRAAARPGPSLEDMVRVEIDLETAPGLGRGATQEAAQALVGEHEARLRQVERQARREAEEKARIEAEEERRREAEDKAKRDEEQRRRKDGEEQERKQAENRAAGARKREDAEEQARLDAENEETERHFAEMEKQLAAREAAAGGEKEPPARDRDTRTREMEAAAARARAEAAEHSKEVEVEEPRVVYRTPINWGKPVALGLFLLLMLGLVLIHFVSFDGYIPQFEKLAGGYLRQPVQIKALHLSLVPLPHWRLDGVSAGGEGQLAVAQINAFAELGTMFSDKKVFKSIELESPVLSEEGLFALLFGKPQGQDFKVASVIVRNGKLSSKTLPLPTLDAKIALGEDGVWQKIAFETPDHKTSLQLESKGELAQLEVETNAFTMPFDQEFILENFVAKGVLGRSELKLSEFKGGIFGGYLSGNASLKWGADWSLGGEFSVRAIDPARIAPALVEEGKLEGKAVYAMRARTYDALFAALRMEGSFAIQKGALLGVDLGRLLQGGGVGGKTVFTELNGSFLREGGKTQLRQLLLAARPVSASGSADVDAGKNISGRFAADLKSPVAHARANVAVSGTLKEPHFNR